MPDTLMATLWERSHILSIYLLSDVGTITIKYKIAQAEDLQQFAFAAEGGKSQASKPIAAQDQKRRAAPAKRQSATRCWQLLPHTSHMSACLAGTGVTCLHAWWDRCHLYACLVGTGVSVPAWGFNTYTLACNHFGGSFSHSTD